jgi:PilZ domain-containing protein
MEHKEANQPERARGWRRLVNLLGNCRVSDRKPDSAVVHVSWRDKFGIGSTQAVCQDLSPGGAAIRCIEPIPLKAIVDLRFAHARARGAVRHRTQKDDAYVVGIEFTCAGSADPCRRHGDELDLATDGTTW